ncbi:MAG: beta-L-arabinofuranosidase domain-containing protein [Thermoguttaceae bacterium]
MSASIVGLLFLSVMAGSAPGAEGPLACDGASPSSTFRFEGIVGQRVDANVDGWLLRAPAANPGLLAMFRLRDRQPKPEIVPWAGEFAGKYLISAIQAMRMTDDPRLRETVSVVIDELLRCQADDGYLGPFPKEERLLKHWDLWGHYHVMLALLMWHDATGDARAQDACRKMADLMAATYLDTGRRMLEAGSDEMNLAVIHGLGRLYRKTGEPRYRRMMEEIVADWEKAGDYFRTGLAGVEYFRIPRPRWESFHDLQGLVELYVVTGDDRYRQAFLHHWHSIRRWDRRNTGAFSSGEQATGTPYEPTAIETCCTIAWMALTVDALRLAGEPVMADELELSTFNGMLGAQHPSGSWWTYSTPMDGVREASQHTIVFQARAGTPELNCCSVNAPRGLGMLSEWAVMATAKGLAVNYYGPMSATVRLKDGETVTIAQETEYPLEGHIRLSVSPERPRAFPLELRIPAWADQASVKLPDATTLAGQPGTYLAIERLWKPGDSLEIELPIKLRVVAGDGPMFGRMSVYRGPLLLAYDTLENEFDEAQLPRLAPAMLQKAQVSFPKDDPARKRIGRFSPWIQVDVPLPDGRTLRLVDFASAGSLGNRYASWLPADQLPPPVPVADEPSDGARVPSGRMLFTLRPPAADATDRTHELVIAGTDDFGDPVVCQDTGSVSRIVVPADKTAGVEPGKSWFWKLIAKNPFGTTESEGPARRFSVDAALAPLDDSMLTEFGERTDGTMVEARLAGSPEPAFGAFKSAQGWKPAPGRKDQADGAVQLDGRSGLVTYALRAFPPEHYTVSLWFSYAERLPRLGQVFSAWCRGADDPLRISVENGELSARIEAGQFYRTAPVAVEPDRWYHVCAVKDGPRLTLFVDGREAAATDAPAGVRSQARDFALGGNPHYTGASEHLACRVAGLRVFARSLTPVEVKALCP